MKKIDILIFPVFFLIIAQSCNKSTNEKPKKTKEYFVFTFESKRKRIDVTDDFAQVTEWIPQKNGNDKEVRTKLSFTKVECDSLSEYAYRIIDNPAISREMLTCNAGEIITIGINYSGTTSKFCKYESVPTWSTLSTDNKKMFNLLNSKTKIPR